MEMHKYLKQYREEVPEWLTNYKPGDIIAFRDVISSRIAYYPGFYKDGSLLKAVNPSQAVHSYIFADYWNSKELNLKQLDNVKGYCKIGHIDWEEEDILPKGNYILNTEGYEKDQYGDQDKPLEYKPHCMTGIYSRDKFVDESIGPERIAITLLCRDGIDAYYQLFICEYKNIPWIFLLQDHGLGGMNYDKFGADGLLDFIMMKNSAYPKYVICENGRGTQIWEGYKKIEEAHPVIGGMHHNVRFLWEYER